MLHVAQFVHRYPPALGGAEAYTARLSEYLASRGDAVTVWTTTAVELNELWKRPERGCAACPREASLRGHAAPPLSEQVQVHRYRPITFPFRRYVLKALSLVPYRPWQAASQPVNPICPRMWKDAGSYDGPLDAVHATAFPYAFPILCARRLAKRRKVPFLLTPFLHLGDPTNPRDRTRRQYSRPHLRWLLNEADTVFVQTPSEREAVLALGVPAGRVVLQGLGVEPSECTGGDREVVRKKWNIDTNDAPEVDTTPLPSRPAVRMTSPTRGEVGCGWPTASLDSQTHLPPPLWGRSTGREADRRVGGLGGIQDPIVGRGVVIGHLANNSIEKGTVDLLKAASSVNCRVVLAGAEMPNFRTFWDGFDGKDRVVRLGVLADEQKRDFFAGIDVFALPSRTDSFGLVLLEAWANGKPVVAYRAGGPADLVRHGVDGLLAKCGDVHDLRAQLRTLIEDAELRTRLGEAGRARVANEFRWEPKMALLRQRMGFSTS